MTGRIPSQLKPVVDKICACGNPFKTSYSRQIRCSRKCADKYNPSRIWKDNHRDYKYKQNYGIDLKEYNEIFNKQNGCCKICKIHQSLLKRRLSVDHNHLTEEVRGLLCSNCNFAIGIFKEDPIIIATALEYVTSPEK